MSREDSSNVFSTNPIAIADFDSLAGALVNIVNGGGIKNLNVRIQARNTERFQIAVEITNIDTKERIYSNLGVTEDDIPHVKEETLTEND